MMFVASLLFNNLWESVVALLAAAIVLRIARHANATTRYAVWTAALVCSVLLPILTTVATMAPQRPAAILPPRTHAATRSAPPVHLQPVSIHQAVLAPASTTAEIRRPQFTLPPMFAIVLAALWGLIAAFNGIRFARCVFVLEALKKNATPLPVEYRSRLSRWQSIAGASHRVRLCVSDEICVPVAVGIFDAMILLPGSLVAELDADDIDRIVLHEYAHLNRGDDWINAFERLALALFFFNPAIRYVARQMDIEREVSCDDSVLLTAGDAVPLATCLVKMVERVAWPYEPLAAPGVFDTRRNLSLRVERLLMFARDRRTRISAVPALGALAAMFALVLIGTLVSPVFVSALPAYAGHANANRKTVAARPQKIATPVSHAQAASTSMPSARPTRAPALAATSAPREASPAVQRPTRWVAAAPSPSPSVSPPPKMKRSQQVGHPTAPSGDYINDLASVGYKNLTVDELIQLRVMGIDANYIRSLQAVGFSNLSAKELIEARAADISPAYVEAMRARFGSLSLRDVHELGALGVSTEYVDQLAAAGYRGLSVRQVEQLRAIGIDAAFINSANAHGFRNLTVDQLIRLKASGVL